MTSTCLVGFTKDSERLNRTESRRETYTSNQQSVPERLEDTPQDPGDARVEGEEVTNRGAYG